jgi:pyridoxamine 5'-phosphate oxidase
MNHAEEIWKTLVRATVDKKHPWRVVGFSTSGPTGPQVRSVILRGASTAERKLVFFTDSRSQKMADIAHDNRVALLFWNARNNTQLRVCGNAAPEASELTVNSHWDRIPEFARKDYATLSAPGTALHTAEGGVELSLARANFTVLNVLVEQMELLQLDRNGHIRVMLALNSAGGWMETGLVP